ncbi:MAG: hypothetical protein ABR559_06325 [Gemmatimonadota bacterium]
MTALFAAHSGLRYLVLLALAVTLVAFLAGWVQKKPFGRPAPLLLSGLIGLVDLQVVLGLVLYFGGRVAPGIIGHLALMASAAVALHLVAVVNRRRPQPTGYGLPLVGVVLAAVLILLGILSIGRAIV